MNSWTDIGLIIAIVIGLISAASLPMVSVNAISRESLRLDHPTRDAPAPWALVSEGKLEAGTASPASSVEAAAADLKSVDALRAKTSAR